MSTNREKEGRLIFEIENLLFDSGRLTKEQILDAIPHVTEEMLLSVSSFFVLERNEKGHVTYTLNEGTRKFVGYMRKYLKYPRAIRMEIAESLRELQKRSASTKKETSN